MLPLILLISTYLVLAQCAGNAYLPPARYQGPSISDDDSDSVVVGSSDFTRNSAAAFKSSSSSSSSFNQQHYNGNFNGINNKEAHYKIVRYENDNNGLGNYRYSYETENNIRHEENGELRNFGKEQAVVVRGSYSYVSPEGEVITINYVADENGFRPEGNHLPTPPPIPDAILKSIEYNRQHGHDWDNTQSDDNTHTGGYKY